MRRFASPAAALVCALSVQSCLGNPDSTAPIGTQSPPSRPAFLISDAAHGGSVAGFNFLPPLVASVNVEGTFDAALQPVVQICELDDALAACASTQPAGLPITFDMNSGPGSETVRVDAEAQLYIVNWHTDQFNLNAGKLYRICVFAGGRQLGFADVDVAADRKSLKDVNTGEYIPLLDGSTLPIKFRAAVAVRPVLQMGQYSLSPVPSTTCYDRTRNENVVYTVIGFELTHGDGDDILADIYLESSWGYMRFGSLVLRPSFDGAVLSGGGTEMFSSLFDNNLASGDFTWFMTLFLTGDTSFNAYLTVNIAAEVYTGEGLPYPLVCTPIEISTTGVRG